MAAAWRCHRPWRCPHPSGAAAARPPRSRPPSARSPVAARPRAACGAPPRRSPCPPAARAGAPRPGPAPPVPAARRCAGAPPPRLGPCEDLIGFFLGAPAQLVRLQLDLLQDLLGLGLG